MFYKLCEYINDSYVLMYMVYLYWLTIFPGWGQTNLHFYKISLAYKIKMKKIPNENVWIQHYYQIKLSKFTDLKMSQRETWRDSNIHYVIRWMLWKKDKRLLILKCTCIYLHVNKWWWAFFLILLENEQSLWKNLIRT